MFDFLKNGIEGRIRKPKVWTRITIWLHCCRLFLNKYICIYKYWNKDKFWLIYYKFAITSMEIARIKTILTWRSNELWAIAKRGLYFYLQKGFHSCILTGLCKKYVTCYPFALKIYMGCAYLYIIAKVITLNVLVSKIFSKEIFLCA